MRFLCILFILGCTHKTSQPLQNTPTTAVTLHTDFQKLNHYKAWLKKQTSTHPLEQKLIFNYLTFLESKKNQHARQLIQQLVQTAKKNQTPVTYQNFGFFKNSPKLIYKSQSLATLSIKYLTPLIEQGDPKAIELSMIYSAAVTIDPFEAELFTPLIKTIHEKYPEVASTVTQKHQIFFQQLPPMMIQ